MTITETSQLFSSFSEAWYFSLVTFTSLGYGDVTLTGHWRLLSGVEAINGIMLIGWSTAMMYSLIQQIYKSLNSN
ncbi:Kef-type K+ transport systems predicted NAD-binding component [Jejuia pallidilutea]|nr:Kef-type K+ transport systems predicted NAD-binding component [Jejuia pallidilutea]GAL89578.1 Kef-type K+ transport systems [Jejuia pallidilutea]